MRKALLATSALAVFGTTGMAMAQDAATSGPSFDEIVVTAQRREEKAQDVPIVITALSPDALRERGVTSVMGLMSQVPSLLVQSNGQASREVMTPSIRGQGASFQGAPGVVMYMNEIPLPIGFTLSTQGGPGNFVDLQSVQALSGVQGTLFGRNTTGGAILLTAAKPTDKLEGHISGSFGNYNLAELEAVVNIPLSDTLKVRLVGASRDRDGFTKDINWNKDRDNIHTRMGRIGVQWDPTDAISSYTMGYYGYSSNNGTGIVPIALNTPYLVGLAQRPIPIGGGATLPLGALSPGFNFCGAGTGPTDCSTLQSYYTDQQNRGVRTVAHGIDDFSKTTTWGINNSTDVKLTDGLKLRNIISYAKVKSFYASDQDGTLSNLNNTGNTIWSRTAPKDYYKLFTEELQLQGSFLDDKLTVTTGGFYSKQSPGGKMEDYSTTVSALQGEVANTAAAGYRTLAMTNESKALFAQATLDLGALTPALDRVRLTGGYRYTWDKIDGFAVNYAPAFYKGTGADTVSCSFNGATVTRANAGNLYNAATDPGCRYEGHLKSSAPNWTIGLDYRPINNLLVYGKVSRGYKAGGFNGYAVNQVFATFTPEYVTDYEAGFKSDFKVAGRPVRLNVNAFNMDYSNIQRGLADYNPTTNKSGAATLSVASARIRGVEVEAMFKPVDMLEIGGTYSHNDAKYKSFKYNAPQPISDCNSANGSQGEKTSTPDLTCIPMQYLSPNIFSVYGRLAIPTADSFGQVSLFVNYAWTDARHQSGPSLEKFPDGSTWEPGSSLAAYGLLNASLDWKNALGQNLDVSVFGTNLTNKTYSISNSGVYNQVGTQSQIFGEPRMYGMRIRYNFGS
jgi:iron complex outermembrane receptor protein